jgi:hypothetical protein
MSKNDIGFYTVGEKKFSSKLDAVLEAQLTDAKVEWHFFNDIFSKVNWTIEPELSLDQLYKIRAQQIRDAYDYVIVFCSGGADSNNVIRSFINNNIHVDEVISMAPLSGLNNWGWDKNDISLSNTVSETKYALFPMLDEIRTKNPNIKITINDFFEDIVNYNSDEWIYNSTGNYIGPATSMCGRLDKFKHLTDLAEQGKRIGLVYGVDKPVISVRNNHVYMLLADAGVNYARPPFVTDYPNVDRVLFYWTHEMPELMIKQGHVVAREMFKPENRHLIKAVQDMATRFNTAKISSSKEEIMTKLIPNYKSKYVPDKSVGYAPKAVFQRGIVPFIYPTTYTKDLFQCQKVDTELGFFTTHQSWFFELHANTRISEMMISDFKLFFNQIHEKYLNPELTGFTMHFHPYSLGPYTNFLPKVSL